VAGVSLDDMDVFIILVAVRHQHVRFQQADEGRRRSGGQLVVDVFGVGGYRIH
jgi:hypothetical protein